jgi:hypothetical protein
MYLLTELNLFPLLLLLALWTLGGWLITARTAIPARERGLISLGLGLVLGTWFANGLARFMPTTYAFWGATLLTIVIGTALAWPLHKELSPRSSIKEHEGEQNRVSFVPLRVLRGKFFALFSKESFQPTQWLLFLFFVFIFTLIGRGFGFFDDHQNLPPVSIMATGDIPPHFAFNPSLGFGYHYFLLLVASQFVRLTSAGPWTALDLARGLTLALTLFYGGFLAYRLTKSRIAESLSMTFILFAGGARWLFLLLPIQLQRQLSSSIQLIGSGADSGPNLITTIYKNWKIEGLGPLPFPFMFGSGLDASFSMLHNGWGTSAITMVLLIILLAPSFSPPVPRIPAERGGQGGARLAIPITILLTSIALANEVTFAFLYLGLAFAALAWMLQHRSIRLPRSFWAWALLMFIAGLLALVQGGMFTEIARGWLQRQVSGQAGTYFQVGFALGPPAVLSAHLGLLSLLNPLQWVAILGETGLAVFAVPIVLKQLGPFTRDENWFEAAWVGSIIVSLLMVFVQYTGNAGPTAASRMIAHFLTVVKIYAVPLIWLWAAKHGENVKSAALAWGLATIFSGLSLFGAQLAAMSNPIYAIYLDPLDAQMFTRHWDQLAPNTMIFDHVYPRAATIFGRPIRSSITMGESLPEFSALDASPDPYKLKAAGYDYLYADTKYLAKYSGIIQQKCVKLIDQVDNQSIDSRYLFQLTDCR